jgi:predicted nucleic acid-binding protein
MQLCFLDASALAKCYLLEAGTARVVELMGRADRIVISRWSLVEVASAAARRARAGDVAPVLLERLLQSLDEESRSAFAVVEVGGAAIARAMDAVRKHALRAADAIQLACALISRGDMGSRVSFVFVSSDRELNDAAAAEGLSIVDPGQE